MNYFAGKSEAAWNPPIQGSIPSGLGSFLTVYDSPISKQASHTTLTGLSPGKTYYLKYNIMSSKSDFNIGATFGESATLTLSNGAIGSQTTDFVANENTSMWIPKILKFTTSSSNARLTFSGKAPLGGNGYNNLDIGFNALSECRAGIDEVVLKNSLLKAKCLSETFNLNDLVEGSAPVASSLVWFDNPSHNGEKLAEPTVAGIGTYYAFFEDETFDCYNTNNSVAQVVIEAPTAVSLKKTTSEVICPANSINLVLEFFSGVIPQGADIRFFNNPNHSGLPLTDLNVGKGTYYAFFYYQSCNGYNQEISTSKMDVGYNDCVDLTPTLEIDGLNFVKGASRDFVVNLYEVKGRGTSGNISFRITKTGSFVIAYPTTSSTSNVLGGIQNENSNWTFTENANFITATSASPISPNGQTVVGFNISRKAGISSGSTQNVTATILNGAGGDNNSKNNSVNTGFSTN